MKSTLKNDVKKINNELVRIRAMIMNLSSHIEIDLCSELQVIKDEQEEYVDYLEDLDDYDDEQDQAQDEYDALDNAIEYLDDVISSLNDAENALDSTLDEIGNLFIL